MRYIVSGIFGIMLGLVALTAGAQTAPPADAAAPHASPAPAPTPAPEATAAGEANVGNPDIEAAKKHFENGLALMEVEDFSSAAVEFEASIAAYPSKNAVFNLGMCYKATHNYEKALLAFRRLINEFGDKIDAESRVDAEKNIAALLRLLAELRVTTSIPGALISIDGIEVGVTPLDAPLVLKVGQHRVRAALEGHKTQERMVTVLGGDQKTAHFELASTTPAVVAPVVPLAGPAEPTQAEPDVPAGQVEHVAPRPPKEIGYIFKVYGAGVGMQALTGVGVVIAVPISLIRTSGFGQFYQGAFPWIFGIAHGFAAIIGGTATWSVGNKSKHYDVSYWAPLVGGFVGNGATLGIGLAVWAGNKDQLDTKTDSEFIQDNLVPIILGYFIGPLLLPPVFEALMYGIARRPEDRYGLAMQWIGPSVTPMMSMSGSREMFMGVSLIGARF